MDMSQNEDAIIAELYKLSKTSNQKDAVTLIFSLPELAEYVSSKIQQAVASKEGV